MGNNISANPCTDFLTDNEYLIHMILPHHQVKSGRDMSNML